MAVYINDSRTGTNLASNLSTTVAGGNLVPLTFVYDFTVLGGAQSALALKDQNGASQVIPDNAIVIQTFIEGYTQLTGGAGATASLGMTGSATNLLGATLVTNGLFAAEAITPGLITPILPVKINNAAGVSVILTPAINNLTAGKLVVHVLYKPGLA